MLPRMTLGLLRSAVPGRATTPAAPRASAVRNMVPTLPGSCTASRTRTAARGSEDDVVEEPVAGLDDGDDALGVLGVGQLGEGAVVDDLELHPGGDEGSFQRLAPAGTFERGRYDGAADRALPAASASSTRRTPSASARPRRSRPRRRFKSRINVARALMRVALSIAGSDPSGGAGIQADLKTFHQFGVYGMAAITALTAQNTVGVSGVHVVPPEFLRQQLEALAADMPPDALKTGMLADVRAGDDGGGLHPRVRLDAAGGGSGHDRHVGRPAAVGRRRAGDPRPAAAPRHAGDAQPG